MLRILFLIMVLGGTLNASASEIYFPYRPTWSVDDYLVFVLAHIPLRQLIIDPNSSNVGVRGDLYVNMTNIPENLVPVVETALRQALKGQRTVSGARLNTSQASVRYSTDVLTNHFSGDFIPELNLAVESAELAREKENGIVRAGPDETPVYDPEAAHRAQCELTLNPLLHTFFN